MVIDIPEFENPSWLNSQDASTINQRMMDNLPDGLDKTEGGFPWDMTKPTALEKSETLQFHLTEALKQTYSFWATYKWLDLHANEQALIRKSAAYAEGTLMVKGISGTIIPEGFVFSTKGSANMPSKLYNAVESVMIDDNGIALVPIKAMEAGADYNTPENTIYLMQIPLTGIESITNEDVITGGADEESDDELRQRVILAERTGSRTGCDADYERWALEVTGVGGAMTDPLWNGPGTVRIIISDVNGDKANETLIERVYNYIVSPNDRRQRLAPIGATVTVDTVQVYDINIRFAFTAVTEADITAICEAFKIGVCEYLSGDARSNMTVSYNRIRSLIEGIEGVKMLTKLEIRPAKEPDVPILEAAEFITIPIGFYPNLGAFERVE